MAHESMEDMMVVLEAAIMSAAEPLTVTDLRRLFLSDPGPDMVRRLLDELRRLWASRGLRLVSTASGWRFQTSDRVRPYLDRLKTDRPPKYSRAVMETLAIVAYRQPVTRGEIESIRGVTVSAQILKTLESRGWVAGVGHKEVPGRPALYGTTKRFLDDLNLRSLAELPALDDLESIVQHAKS